MAGTRSRFDPRDVRDRVRGVFRVQAKDITWQAGVDVRCFGGTRNGTQAGEAVSFFSRDLAPPGKLRCGSRR